jgi:hypothetical protein|tara:strand:+ start:569 stop:1018 length:450 start_codon:yes stop_codon:yes gene_type:complete
MNDYTKGILTGASLILCFFMFVGANRQGKEVVEFGTVIAKTVIATNMMVRDDLGQVVIGAGALATFNPERKETAYLGTTDDGGGQLTTSNSDGKQTAYLGTGESGNGYLKTYNEHKEMTGYFGTNEEKDGVVVLFDRYGDAGWSASGKK